MKLSVVPIDTFNTLTKPYDMYIPEEEATDSFWSSLRGGLGEIRSHLSLFGTEGVEWELPDHSQRCRVLYAYLYSDTLYSPALPAGLAAAIPNDGKPWCIELECYTDGPLSPHDGPFLLGWAALIDGTLYVRGDNENFIGYVSRFGLPIA